MGEQANEQLVTILWTRASRAEPATPKMIVAWPRAAMHQFFSDWWRSGVSGAELALRSHQLETDGRFEDGDRAVYTCDRLRGGSFFDRLYRMFGRRREEGWVDPRLGRAAYIVVRYGVSDEASDRGAIINHACTAFDTREAATRQYHRALLGTSELSGEALLFDVRTRTIVERRPLH